MGGQKWVGGRAGGEGGWAGGRAAGGHARARTPTPTRRAWLAVGVFVQLHERTFQARLLLLLAGLCLARSRRCFCFVGAPRQRVGERAQQAQQRGAEGLDQGATLAAGALQLHLEHEVIPKVHGGKQHHVAPQVL